MRRRDCHGPARFITFSCEHRLPLLGRPAIRDVFVASLAEAQSRFSLRVFAWVVMPEHVHLLLRADPESMIDALRFLKMSVAQRVISRWRRLEAPILGRLARPDGSLRFWLKGGGFDRNVRDRHELSRTIAYIHQNPVERELVLRASEWRWSSVAWWRGEESPIKCEYPAQGWESWRGFEPVT
ncbi:MAG: transposase [Phycisphaerales bacterium]|nr:transposase [Phycisphaerales bacterium]